jgi:hypothetical protein
MKRLLILIAFCILGLAEGYAQQHIDALLNGNLYNSNYNSNKSNTTFRMAVKRDPETGEVIKKVTELVVRDNKALNKRFIEAFKAEQADVDVWQEKEYDGIYDVTAIWSNPKRIYKLKIGTVMIVSAQVIYKEE